MGAAINFISEDRVKLISSKNNEPEWLKNARLDSFKSFLELPARQFADSPTQTAYTDLDLAKMPALMLGKARIDVEDRDYLKQNNIEVLSFSAATNNNAEMFKKHFMNIIEKDSKLNSLHAAYVDNGLLINVPDNTMLDMPIKIEVNSQDEGNHFNHIIFIVGKNCQLDYDERYISSSKEEHLNSDFLEVYIGENSKVNVNSLQDYGKNVSNIAVKKSTVNKNSKIKWVVANLGSKKVMSVVDNTLAGELAEAYNYGIFLGKSQHFDITNNANHIEKHTKGEILTKGAMFNDGVSVYRGEIIVSDNARQTDSNLAGHTLVFEGAKANAIPSLKIKTNDVMVKHAASVSQVDEEKLFYVMSRGLSREQAVREIILGHFGSVLDKIEDVDKREEIRNLVIERLDAK